MCRMERKVAQQNVVRIEKMLQDLSWDKISLASIQDKIRKWRVTAKN